MSAEQKLNVLYVINGLGTGGAERSLVDLMHPLEDLGVHVKIAVLHDRSEGVQREVPKQLIHQIGPSRSKAVWRLRRLITELGSDLVHTTIWDSDIVGRLAAVRTGVPVLTSIVNTSYSAPARAQPGISPTKLQVGRMLDGWTARHLTSWYHTLTEDSKAAAVAALEIDPSRITVVPRGRDAGRLGQATESRRRTTRKRLSLDEETTVLLSVGRREFQKGQIHAIDAVPALLDQDPGLILLIAGRDGAASVALDQRVAELGIENSVRFLGHRNDVPDLMVAADALVFPSLYEGLGGTVIEAMALGLPVVASDISVLREVVGDSALLFRAGDPASLAETTMRLLNSTDLVDELTKAGRNRFEKCFTLDRIGKEMADMYRSVTARHTSK